MLDNYIIIAFRTLNTYQVHDPVSESDKLMSRSAVLNYLAQYEVYHTMADRHILNGKLGYLSCGFSMFIDLETKETKLLKPQTLNTSSDEIGWKILVC